MPIPFILGAAAVGAGLLGLKKGGDAVSNNKESERLINKAQRIYEEAKEELEYERDYTTNRLSHLGELKLNIWADDFGRFVSLYEKFKNISIEGSANVDSLFKRNLEISTTEFIDMKEMSLKASEVVSGGVGVLGAGALAGIASYGGAMMFASASTGTAISALSGVAATNATLAWFGGGSLAAGGLGMAGGTAILGGIVLGPVLAVGGFLMASKAEENLAEAKKTYRKAEHAVEEINTVITLLKGVQELSGVYQEAIQNISCRYKSVLDSLENVMIASKEKQSSSFINRVKAFLGIKSKIDFNKLTIEEQRILQMSVVFTQVLKTLLETPLLNKNGEINNEAYNVIEKLNENRALLVE